MKITSQPFGKTSNHKEVTEYTMTNNHGASVSILTYGGVINKVIVPDAKGQLANVVIGYDSIQEYETCSGFIGAAIGRSAGRIAGGKLTIDKVLYQLPINQASNNLHGGDNGFDKQIFEATELLEDKKASVTLHYLSPDMEGGFPGNLDVNITYSFDDDNALTLKYVCTTDKKTFVNLTNHSYFNLSSDYKTKILDHELMIKADHVLAVDEVTIPVSIVPVKDTPFDFTSSKPIGRDIDADNEQIKFGSGYDHAFQLNQPGQGPQIVTKDPKTGRIMEVTTDEACVVFYSGNFLEPDCKAQDGTPLHPRAAFCLETQYYPDCMNNDFLEPKFLSPDQVYRSKTTYKFSV